MRPIFVDTAALIALGNKRDWFHIQATKLLKQCITEQRRFVTTNAVLLELTNAFGAATYKSVALRLIYLIQTSPQWDIVFVDEALMERGLKHFAQRADKDWSLVDCIGMLIAEDFGCAEIFTNDHHFEQAGFVNLMHKE